MRKNHPVFDRATGKVICVDIVKARPEQMRLSFSGHLSLDLESYDQDNPFGAILSIKFSFTPDIEESKMSVHYA